MAAWLTSFFRRVWSIRKRLLWRVVPGAALCGAVVWWGVPWLFPLPDSLGKFSPPGTVLLYRNGDMLACLPGEHYYRGAKVSLGEIPQEFIEATLAAEDKRFFEHGGLDFIALARALRSNARASRIVSGASTISQQLIKIASPRSARNLKVKFREFFCARRLEMTYDKSFILEEYFNRLDYGNSRMGPLAAARFYFDLPLRDLSLAQTALLVSLPQSPSRLNPLRHPERALKRRNWVLDRLAFEFGYSAERIERARREPLECREGGEAFASAAPHLAMSLWRRDGRGTVRTTLEPSLQETALRSVKSQLELLKDKDVRQAAVLVVDNATGDILAWVGSGNRRDPKGGLLDAVSLPRSAGSTLKPFVYALAFEKGSWPGEILPDVLVSYRTGAGLEAPKNFDHVYDGPVSVRSALARSRNIPAMKSLERNGGAARLLPLLNRLGFSSLDGNASGYGLGLAIGNAEIRLMDLVRAYAVMARGGTAVDLSCLAERERPVGDGERLLSRDVCFVLADMMSDIPARAGAFDENGPLNLPFPCAVKTGTSSDFRDNWCIGFTPAVTVGVWVGNFDFERMRNVSGVSGAGPIFREVMTAAHAMRPSGAFEPPPGVVRVVVDKRNGLRPGALNVPKDFLREEWAFRDKVPRLASPADYDAEGRALLPSAYGEWLRSESNTFRDMYALASPGGEAPVILNPPAGSLFLIDPELPGQGRTLALKSSLGDRAVWSCETLRILTDGEEPRLELAPGEHRLRVHDRAAPGRACERLLKVKSL